ncbi:YgaP-like transmembrane domain [Haloferax volcanii]|uniref:YgaP-like transmembrane domain n=1 Tax=Haloferax volcanii TaxID=2246 RepID=UPI00385F069B
MVRNVGTLDRTVRLALGPLLVVGVVLLVTGAGRTCPLYLPFGIDTFDDRD